MYVFLWLQSDYTCEKEVQKSVLYIEKKKLKKNILNSCNTLKKYTPVACPGVTGCLQLNPQMMSDSE